MLSQASKRPLPRTSQGGFATRFALLLFFVLAGAYLSLYSWNLKSRALDRLADSTGLEFALVVLKPGEWVTQNITHLWETYVHVVDVERENEQLRSMVSAMALELAGLREDSARVRRLEDFLVYDPPVPWRRQGARVLAQAMGPAGVMDTIMVDKGERAGIAADAPVVTPGGLVGRVLRVSPSSATVLLLEDPNSRVPVLGRSSRVSGVLSGQGRGQPLLVNYVPVSDPLEEGEELITSDLAGGLPKGLPVARVSAVQRSDNTLFKTVLAEPLVGLRGLEEVLVLTREAQPAVVAEPPRPDAKAPKDRRPKGVKRP